MAVEKAGGKPPSLARQLEATLQSVKCAFKKKKKEEERRGEKKKTFPTHTSTAAATHPLGYEAGEAALCHPLRHALP